MTVTHNDENHFNTNLDDSDTVTKFQTAAEIVNRTLVKVVEKCVAGAKVVDICAFGDEELAQGTAAVYNKSKNGKKVPKGIAFPTCLNVNHQVCHFSPLPNEPEGAVELKDGDLVKIELGAHIDGFPAMLGYTAVVGASKSKPVTGRKADVIHAANTSADAALRLLRPDKTNFDITDTVQKICVDTYGCIPVEGILSSQLRRTVLDGDKQIIFNPLDGTRNQIKTHNFALGEFYSIDILISTSKTGKSKRSESRTTIFKLQPDNEFQLKLQASRKVLSEVKQKAGFMPFNLRNLAAETLSKARMGVNECLSHQMMLPYEVLEDNEGEFVAQFMFTALLLPSGNILKITNFPALDSDVIKTDKVLEDPELKKLITSSTKAPKKAKAVGAVAAAPAAVKA